VVHRAEPMWIEQQRYKTVGKALASARERAGLTQVQLAKALRKPQSFVSSFESGQRRIDVLELIKVVNQIGADPKRVFAEILSHFNKK
jgi:transcriptional regulator with XRE-family HTH domain